VKLLVTGGAGFIGSNFVRYILKKYPSYRIVNLDKLTYAGNRGNISDLNANPRHEFIRGDIADRTTVDEAMAKVDAAVNFAAETHVDRSIASATAFIKTNISGTHTLLESARKHRLSRFVHISTDEVYGSIPRGSFTEKSGLNPSSPYSSSKAGADLIARSYFITHKVPVIITRSSNNFGPFQYPEKVIPLFVINALEDKPLPLYGNGLNVRDWLYVLDNCEAIDKVLHKGKDGEIYNIGGSTHLSNVELTKKILEMLGKSSKLIKKVDDRPAHDFRYAVNCTKIANDLGWRPRAIFDEALAATITWYEINKPWWKKIINNNYREYYRKQYGRA